MTESSFVSIPAISVVVPVYNAGAYLAPLLACLLAQTERSLQIIAVDDGSSDGSLALLRDAATRDPRLTVLSQSNRGISAARNLGLDHARGRWVGFADSDDWLDPRAFETWRTLGDQAGLEAVFGNGFRFEGDANEPVIATSEPLVQHRPPTDVFSGADWIRHCVAHSEWPHYVWLQLIRRDVLARSLLRFDEDIVHEDVLWCMQLGLRLQRIGFFAEPLYGYRVHPGSFTQNRTVETLHRRAQSYLVLMRHFTAAADERRHDRPLRRALLRHAQREGRHLFSLMREGVLSPAMRQELGEEFFRLGLLRTMFEGAENLQTYWRAARCWFRFPHPATR
jgi:glycosyltransferase involved in cell wall biosynthesis